VLPGGARAGPGRADGRRARPSEARLGQGGAGLGGRCALLGGAGTTANVRGQGRAGPGRGGGWHYWAG
jgi:hypothetical protein